MSKILYGYNNREITREQLCKAVGPGWRKLVEDLIDDLFTLGWNGHVFQVKEKFGGLRFYIGEGNPVIYNRINEAEDLSFHICEECGEPGERYYDGWIKTLCPKHAAEKGRVKYEGEGF